MATAGVLRHADKNTTALQEGEMTDDKKDVVGEAIVDLAGALECDVHQLINLLSGQLLSEEDAGEMKDLV